MTQTRDQVAVSVVIPAYNVAWCIGKAVDSVMAQSYANYEVIVVNDGSTDNTTSVLAGYGDRLCVVQKTNGGLSSARNAGIRVARGRLVAFLDADDQWLSRKLEKQVSLMSARPELAFCSTAALLEDPAGTPLGEWRCGDKAVPALEGIFSENAYVAGSGSAVMVRMEAFQEVGGFDESLRSLEDIDMWMRLSAIGGFACIEEPLTIIQKRPGSMSGNLDMMREAAISVMRRNRRLLPREKQGGYWRHAFSGMLSDYAKWAWRSGHRQQAVRDLLRAFLIAPVSRGRLIAGLSVAMILGRKI